VSLIRKVLFLTLALAVLLPVGGATACVKSRKVLVENGLSPSGEPWSVKAKRSRNGNSCDNWLFQVQFSLPKVVGWAAATSIPIGGHTPNNFTITALDAEGLDGLERAFSGYTGRKAARVVAVLENGSRIGITTKSPPRRLRKTYVWMRGFRYFVYYYLAGSGVRSIKLLAKSGKVLYSTRVEPGGYFL
jgi:hypothetical protein